MQIMDYSSWTDIDGQSSPVRGRRSAAGGIGVFRWLWDWAIRKHRARRDTAELASMSDRMLDDIGVSRCELELVVRRGRGE